MMKDDDHLSMFGRDAVQRLPMLESDPRDIESILARTVERHARFSARFGWSRRLGAFAAVAALLSMTMIGAWVTNPDHEYTGGYTEAELARLEFEVEFALHRLGTVLHETERLTVNGLDRRRGAADSAE